MNLNKAMIIGNVTRDPESRTIPSGQTVTNFGVATNRVWKNAQTGEKQQSTEFHNIVAWGRLAETCRQYLKKGSKVYIEGRLQTRSWQDTSGVKKYRTEIVAESMIMLDRAGTPASAESPVPSTEETQASAEGEEEIKIEDIPF